MPTNKERRKSEFRNLASRIVHDDRSQFDFNRYDLGGNIARELEKAYQKGKKRGRLN